LCARSSRIFSYSASRSGISSTGVSRGNSTQMDAASSMAMPPSGRDQPRRSAPDGGSVLMEFLLTSLPLMRQKRMRGIPHQRRPPTVPGGNPVHVEQRPDLERAGVRHLQQRSDGWIEGAEHVEEHLLRRCAVPSWAASAR
jgi:hypothetical protein